MKWLRMADEVRIEALLKNNEARVLLDACTERTLLRVDSHNSPLKSDKLILEMVNFNEQDDEPDDEQGDEDDKYKWTLQGDDDFMLGLCGALHGFAASTCEVVAATSPDNASASDSIERCDEGIAALELEEELQLAVLARQHNLHERVAEILRAQNCEQGSQA